jgi:transposase
VRVTTAFKRLLRLPGASVIDVDFTAEGVIVTVRLRRRRRVCAECGQTGQVRRDEWNAHERSHTPTGRWVKGTRWSPLKAPENQTIGQLATLADVQAENRRLYRAFLLREELRLLYHLDDPSLAPAHLDAWIAWASRSRLTPFIRLARTLRAHRDGILAAIRLGLSNGRLEGLNSKIRLISHRSYGFHSADALIALDYLCCTGIVIELPR